MYLQIYNVLVYDFALTLVPDPDPDSTVVVAVVLEFEFEFELFVSVEFIYCYSLSSNWNRFGNRLLAIGYQCLSVVVFGTVFVFVETL